KMMIVADAVRCAVLIAFAVLYAAHALSLGMLYGGLVVVSIAAAAFLGGQASSIPYLLGKERGTEAAAALSGAENVSNLVTPVVGGAIFSLFGPLPALAINAVTYAASQVSLSRIPSLGPESPAGMPRVAHIIDDVGIGFRILFADRAMRAVTFAGFFINLLGFGMYTVLVPLLKHDFAATDTQVGIFMGVAAVGAVGGSLFASRFATRWPFGAALAVAFVVDASFFALIPFAHNMWGVAVLWATANAGWQFEVAQIIGFRLRATPEEYVGRLFGAVRILVLCGIGPGVPIVGYLADHFSPHTAISVLAAAYLVVAVVAALTPAIRTERR
ncbi:MAG: MFS transporter, partial [Candidatus Eremiobacteraeota bacterium]|nr:MFS transporter [Candidatus Eremiobacteraeota bacterium]